MAAASPGHLVRGALQKAIKLFYFNPFPYTSLTPQEVLAFQLD